MLSQRKRSEGAMMQEQLVSLDDVLEVMIASRSAGCSALEAAAARGKLELLAPLLKQYLPPQRGSGREAAADQPAPTIPILPPEIVSQDLAAAFLAAAEQGQHESLRMLLDSGPSPAATMLGLGLLHARGKDGDTALTKAVGARQTLCMQLLLQHAPEQLVQAVGLKSGRIALHAAAARGDTGCMELLLAHRPAAQVAAADASGMTALMEAALGGHSACMRLLLAHTPGLQVEAVNSGGCNALMHAAAGGHTECVQLLLAHSPDVQLEAISDDEQPGFNALMLATSSGHAQCVEQLLRAGRPQQQMAVVSPDGWHALSLASINGHVGCLSSLLLHGPEQEQLDDALDSACYEMMDEGVVGRRRQAMKQCVELLLAKGAVLTGEATAAQRDVLRPISRDLAARALTPGMANEAVVGLALAATSSCKRSADASSWAGRQPEPLIDN